MMLREATKTPSNYHGKTWYRRLSLVDLIKEIVDKIDPQALEEFHNNRTLFRYTDRPPLTFIWYLNELRESAARREWPGINTLDVAYEAYDLTLDKFSNLPGATIPSTSSRDKNGRDVKQNGPDCRLYFTAFVKRVAKSFEEEPPEGEFEAETRAAKIMQGLVRRHFYLSLLEGERKSDPFWSRYYWEVKGCKICLWLPVYLKGRERREWLEKNLDNPNPLGGRERQRIQAIISRALVKERLIPISEASVADNDELTVWPRTKESPGIPLAEVVAEEKARNIQHQRRSIKSLGKKTLKQLILRIFNDLSYGEYKDGKVAKQFGLSKATFSRFAGSQWLETESAMPDLWLNTAQVLSEHPTFKEVAKKAGVWQQVEITLEKGTQRRGKEPGHAQ